MGTRRPTSKWLSPYPGGLLVQNRSTEHPHPSVWRGELLELGELADGGKAGVLGGFGTEIPCLGILFEALVAQVECSPQRRQGLSGFADSGLKGGQVIPYLGHGRGEHREPIEGSFQAGVVRHGDELLGGLQDGVGIGQGMADELIEGSQSGIWLLE